MRRACLVAALLLLFGLPGCEDSRTCEFFPADLHSPEGMLLVDRPEELTIFADVGRAGDCEGVADPTISSVFVEIFDPEQQPVAHESSLVTPGTPAASIRFTPAGLGRYHFFVAFDPLGQIQQFDLLSARDRSTEPPVQTLPSGCNSLERTRSGTWICDTRVFRGPALERNLPGVRVAVWGDVVWVASGSQLLRYKDSGTELQLTATMAQPLGLAEYILASEDEAVLLLNNWLQRVTFNGTALTATPVTRWERPTVGGGTLGDDALGIIVRAGEQLAIVQNASSPGGGVRIQSCAYELIEGYYVRTPQPCQLIDGLAMGFEPSVLWVADISVPDGILIALRRLELRGGGFVPTAELPLASTIAFTFPMGFRRSSALPVLRPRVQRGNPLLRAAVPVYVPEQSLIRLEHMDEELSGPQASASYFWGNTPQGNGTSTSVRIRAIAPPP
jgi:hypothetical protein